MLLQHMVMVLTKLLYFLSLQVLQVEMQELQEWLEETEAAEVEMVAKQTFMGTIFFLMGTKKI